jgi:(S)-3,5-dihydroxyphenylglycine transaminase
MSGTPIGDGPLLAMDGLHAVLTDPVLDAMSLLNEIAARFPDAVSLAPGWPPDDQFTIDDVDRYLRHYTEYLRAEGLSADAVRRQVFQYGPTSGTIRELVARFLARTEDIDVDPRAILMTTGCQEAMLVVLRALFAQPEDVLLVQSPGYFGVVGAARILGIPIHRVPERPAGLDPEDVAEAADQLRAAGRRPRALYVMPDFANPSGRTIGPAARDRLRAVASQRQMMLLEDSPYRFFSRSGRRLPTLKATDTERCVVLLGSFSKTCFPGARVGYIVADQQVRAAGGRLALLAEHLTKVKSMTTINTSALAQAVVGGMLIAHDFDLLDANAVRIAVINRRMDTLLGELHRRLDPLRDRYPELEWTEPGGGFFVSMRLPFEVDLAALEDCAARFGVLWTPMSLFYEHGGRREIRLSPSYAAAEEIVRGVQRLAKFVLDRSS